MGEGSKAIKEVFVFLIIAYLPSALNFHHLPTTMAESNIQSILKQLLEKQEKAVELQYEADRELFVETARKSVASAIESATGSFARRQDLFEHQTSNRLAILMDRITSLKLCLF